jgi:hypothetical protein
VVQAPVFCGTDVELSGHTGKEMLLIFSKGGDAEFLETAASNLPKILVFLIDDYRDLWDKM